MKSCHASLFLMAIITTAHGQSLPSEPPHQAPDLSSPRAALLTVYSSLRAGDIQTLKSCLLFDDPAAADLFDVSLAQVCAPLRLMHAMEARFGSAGRKPFDPSVEKSIDQAIARVKIAEITITGDTAVVAEKKAALNPDAETELSGVTLKRQADASTPEQWKVVASTFPDTGGDMSPKQLALMRSLRDALVLACQTTITRLQHGDFQTPDQAYASYQSLLQPSANAAAQSSPPTSAPSSTNR